MAGEEPEEQVELPVVQQDWRDVAFLHWRIDPDALAPLLPLGLAPDVVDGTAWLGCTPFRVERFRVLGLPAIPWLSSLPETNLRTYVRHEDGREGLWFLSIDVGSTANAAGGRLVGVPYFRSRMSLVSDGCVRYRSSRALGPRARHDIEIRPGDPIEPDATVAALTGRWRAYARAAGRLLEVAVEHGAWPLRSARLTRLDQTLTDAVGLPGPDGEPLVHFADGVDARLGPPRRPQPA